MNGRRAAAGFWFFLALYAGSMLHGIAGLNELVGPAIGLMSAALIVADPFQRLAAVRARVSLPSEVATAPADLPSNPSELPRAA